MINKLYSYVGLIQKSGNLISGNDAVEIDIKKKKCKLLIISDDASENTKKKFDNLAKLHNINYVNYGNKEDFGRAIGKSARSVLSIKDKNFAKGFLNKIFEINTGGESVVKNKNLWIG